MAATSPSLVERSELSKSAREFAGSPAVPMAHALFGREFRAALINRYFQVFCALGLMGGIAAAIFGEDANATAVFYIQIAIYFVSLFALLAGVGSAQAEREEWQLLFTQPLPRAACVVGKFCALLSMFGGVLLLMFVPGFLAGSAIHALASLYFETFLLAATFLACGLATGYLAHDRAQGLIVGVSAWLLLLFGLDLMALFAARWSAIQNLPDLWVALLMLNPLDSFRIHALFALQQIPAEAANKTPLASWWIAHAGGWFATVAALWSATLIALAGLRLNHWEE
jgi:ABC-2 type transport system permease protein/Cu-processing system permease protein